MNRIHNLAKHVVLLKFIALALLPKDEILLSFNRLILECRKKYGTYFDLFIDYYTREWIEGWKPEVFSVYRLKHLMKNFLDCYGYRKHFNIGKELHPLAFLGNMMLEFLKI